MSNQTLEELKSQADLIGVTYSSNIGLESLKKKVDAKMAEEDGEPSVVTKTVTTTTKATAKLPKGAKPMSKTEYKVRQAKLLIKVRVTNLCAGEAKMKGEIVGAGNEGFDVQRFVPYNKPMGLEKCLIDKLNEQKMIQYIDEEDDNGRRTLGMSHQTVKKYAIEYLD